MQTSTIVLACPTIQDEIEKAKKELGLDYDTHYLKNNDHNYPQQLHESLQEILDQLEGYSTVILALGSCNGATDKLRTGEFSMVLPRSDDCVTLLMGSAENRKRASAGSLCFFLTKGWINSDYGIAKEIDQILERYGSEQAQDIIDLIYGSISKLILIDTGAYSMDSIQERMDALAHHFPAATTEICQGDSTWLRDLLSGPWDNDRFICVPPNSSVAF